MNISALLDKHIPPKTRSLLRSLGALAASNSYEIYLVGGIVRDLLLDRDNLDIDIAVDGDGQAFAVLVAETMGGTVVMHGRFGTSVVILPEKTRVDIATARTETYSRPGALPDVAKAPIEYDLKRRDFSINAMAVSLNPKDFGELADYYGGRDDLETRTIRSLYAESFIDDPTRILRAARFEGALGFRVDPGTEDSIKRAVKGGYLGKVSGARLRKEIFAIAESQAPANALKRLDDFGVWNAMVPGLKPPAAAYRAIEGLDRAEQAMRGGLKPGYKKRFAVLTALLMFNSPDAATALCCIIDLSRFRGGQISGFAGAAAGLASSTERGLSPSALYEALTGLPEEGLAVLWSAGSVRTRQAVEAYVRFREVKPLITGRDLIKWGYPPSKKYAAVLNALFMLQLDGKIKTRAEAKAAAEKGILEYT